MLAADDSINGMQQPAGPQKTSTLGSSFNVLCIVVGSFAGNGSLDVGVDESFAPTAPIEAAQ